MHELFFGHEINNVIGYSLAPPGPAGKSECWKGCWACSQGNHFPFGFIRAHSKDYRNSISVRKSSLHCRQFPPSPSVSSSSPAAAVLIVSMVVSQFSELAVSIVWSWRERGRWIWMVLQFLEFCGAGCDGDSCCVEVCADKYIIFCVFVQILGTYTSKTAYSTSFPL